MNLNKLERKFGKYAIPNLSLWIIGSFILGYMLSVTAPDILSYMKLEPYLIFHEWQVWRIFTWVIMPPERLSFFTVIMLFFYYSLGSSLERTWGTFRYNLYIFSGVFATVIGAIILYFVLGQSPISIGNVISTKYINYSIFLAFATFFPNMQVLLYFVIPVKIKWLAWIYVIYLGFSFVNVGFVERYIILISLLNFIIFFFNTRNYRRVSPKEIHRKRAYRQQTAQTPNTTKHKCAICGRTEKDGDDLVFRFCSKCEGNYEYCQDHLFTHEHRKKS